MENLINLKLGAAETKHLLWMDGMYAHIVYTYIDFTSTLESGINDCIAFHFLGGNKKLSNEFISEVIMKLPFRNKHIIFKRIMSKNYNELWKKYENVIEEIYAFYEKRTTFSHSFLNANPTTLMKFETHRIAYRNMGASLDQPCYIELTQFNEDKKRLLELIGIFETISNEMKKNREA